ncbi:hypothetical protein MTO96_000274 [Rhipicephalus appendiculatus]
MLGWTTGFGSRRGPATKRPPPLGDHRGNNNASAGYRTANGQTKSLIKQVTEASRLPKLPRNEIKVIICPKGGHDSLQATTWAGKVKGTERSSSKGPEKQEDKRSAFDAGVKVGVRQLFTGRFAANCRRPLHSLEAANERQLYLRFRGASSERGLVCPAPTKA